VRLRGLTLGLLPFALAAALCLVQVLPAFLYLRQGHRQPLPFADSLRQGLWNRLVALLVPDFFGNPTDANWWGPGNYNETTLYLGLLPLFLTALAPLLRRGPAATFFLVWGAIGLLWALGTPAYGVLYVLPVFGGLLPSRAAFLVTLSVAFLAAIVFDRLLESTAGSRRLPRAALLTAVGMALLAGMFVGAYRPEVATHWSYLASRLALGAGLLVVSLALLLARLLGLLGARPFAAVALLVVTADLFLAGRGYNTIGSTAALYPPTGVERFLTNQATPFRIATLPEGVAYPPNSSLIVPLENASGYEPAILQRVVDYVGAAEGQSAIYFERELMPLRSLSSPLIDLMNVKYVVTIADWLADEPVAGPTQEVAEAWLPLAPSAPWQQLFSVPDAGLHRVGLRLRPLSASGMVTVRLLTQDGEQELAHAATELAAIDPDGWTLFYFEAFPSEWGRQFRLSVEVENPDGTGDEALLMVGASRGDRYAGGALIGGEGDLAFSTAYFPRPQLVFEDGKSRVYLNDGYLPRAFAVAQAVIAPGRAEALATLLDNQERLDELVVLELEGQTAPPLTDSGLAPGRVAITRYELNQIRLEVEMERPGYLFLGEAWYPGWRASVNGERAPLYRGNYLFRALYLPAGRSEIVMRFLPADFLFGAAVSGLTFVACLIYLAISSRRSSTLSSLSTVKSREPSRAS
jgi:hypothetical protein